MRWENSLVALQFQMSRSSSGRFKCLRSRNWRSTRINTVASMTRLRALPTTRISGAWVSVSGKPLSEGSQRVLSLLVLAANDQLSSVAQREQAVAAPDGAAVLYVIKVHDRAAMDLHEICRAEAIVELFQRGANPITQSSGMYFDVV